MLSASLLTGLSSCGLERTLPVPPAVQHAAPSREAKPLSRQYVPMDEGKAFVEKLIEQYRHDPERLRRVASQYEDKSNWELALVLYKSIDDEAAAKQLLRKTFRGGYSSADKTSEYGFRPSIDDLIERAISESGCGDWGPYFEYAEQACEQSSNKEALRRLALKLEDNAQQDPGCHYNLKYAIKCYRKIGDGDAIGRIAEIASRRFIEGWPGDEISFRTECGLTVSKDLWNRRGRYWMKKDDLSRAVSAYKEAGNLAGLKEAARQAEREKDYWTALNAAHAAGDLPLARELAKKVLLQSPAHPAVVDRTLKLVGLEKDTNLYRQIAHAQAQLGSFAYAVQLYEKIGDQEGIRKALALATSAGKK